eukprot:13844575-Alexandrium_andersonii.AAC.1
MHARSLVLAHASLSAVLARSLAVALGSAPRPIAAAGRAPLSPNLTAGSRRRCLAVPLCREREAVS